MRSMKDSGYFHTLADILLALTDRLIPSFAPESALLALTLLHEIEARSCFVTARHHRVVGANDI